MTHIDIMQRDTICAVITGIQRCAVSMIRVSGPDAGPVLNRIFTPKKGSQAPFVATLGNIGNPTIDEGLCTYFPGPKSYTGENCFELSVHGNPLIVRETLRLLQTAGARLAQPGEFTRRAVLNQKMDLCAAEAVSDLIEARSERAAQAALQMVKGQLSSLLDPIYETITDALCEVQARLDFPEDGLGDENQAAITNKIEHAKQTLTQLLKRAHFGKRLFSHAKIVLYGEPNAGKSTLLNALLGEERALVHDMPGTTRDVIESEWILDGFPTILMDVAGIRISEHIDPVEQMGIERAQKALQHADIVIVFEPIAVDDAIMAKRIDVISKIDLGIDIDNTSSNAIRISAKTGAGLTELKAAIKNSLLDDAKNEDTVFLTRARQCDNVEECRDALSHALELLEVDQPLELLASELRQAGMALDRLLGRDFNQDVFELIFSRFCIGK